jgi:hypothetical protein
MPNPPKINNLENEKRAPSHSYQVILFADKVSHKLGVKYGVNGKHALIGSGVGRINFFVVGNGNFIQFKYVSRGGGELYVLQTWGDRPHHFLHRLLRGVLHLETNNQVL